MPRVEFEPFHEPIGHSPEIHTISRRWIMTLVVAMIVAAAGVALALRSL